MSKLPATVEQIVWRVRPVRRTKQRGVAMIVVLVLTSLAVIVATTLSRGARTDVRIAHNNRLALQALAAAEAGVLHALKGLETNFSGSFSAEIADGVGGGLTGVGNVVDLDGVDYRTATLGDATYYVRVDDNVDESGNDRTVDVDGYLKLTAIGQAGTARRRVIATLRAGMPGYGIYARTSLTVSGSMSLDSYDSSAGAYSALNSEDAALIGANVLVDLGTSGRVGADVHTAGSTTRTSSLTGTITTDTPVQEFDSVTPCAAYSLQSSFTGGSYNTASGDLVSAGAGSQVVLQAGDYCFHDIKISGSGQILLGSTPVRIFITGDADLGGNAIVNPSNLPSNLTLLSSGGMVKVNGGSTPYMDIYAPDSNVEMGGSGHAYGSILGDTVLLFGSGDYHTDVSGKGWGAFEITTWFESR